MLKPVASYPRNVLNTVGMRVDPNPAYRPAVAPRTPRRDAHSARRWNGCTYTKQKATTPTGWMSQIDAGEAHLVPAVVIEDAAIDEREAMSAPPKLQ
jgi:hypothetical protein